MLKTLAATFILLMYHKNESPSTAPENFELPFAGKLSEKNRWVVMEKLIPWSEFEAEYAENFSAKMGAPAKTFKMALGSLIIKEILGTSDRETVEHIKENPYLQYFIGLTSYINEAPFDASTLVHFRQKISQETIKKINKRIVKQALPTGKESGVKNKKKVKKKTKIKI